MLLKVIHCIKATKKFKGLNIRTYKGVIVLVKLLNMSKQILTTISLFSSYRSKICRNIPQYNTIRDLNNNKIKSNLNHHTFVDALL